MVDLKEAIRRAKDYAAQVLELSPPDMLLEEVRSSDDKYWSITLSFNARVPRKRGPTLESFMRSYDDDREFKSFRINKDTGDVEGMFNVQPV